MTLTDCQSGNIIAKFRAFEMYQHDGTMTDTGAAPGDPTSRGPGLGTWEFVGGPNGQTYTAVFRFFRFNPDGTPAGTAVVRREIELGLKARHLVSTVTFQFLDTNDNVIASGCGTERSVRKQ